MGNQAGRGTQPTITIKGLLKADGYDWNTKGWQAWCRTYPATDFSVEEFFNQATWFSSAYGVEVRFYDDLENMMARYSVELGQCTPIIDNIFEVDL